MTVRSFTAVVTRRIVLAILLAGTCISLLPAQAQGQTLRLNTDYSFESFNARNHYMRHGPEPLMGSLTTVSTDLDYKDATWRVVRGLAGRGVSLESLNFPGYYLRHQGFRLKLHRFDGTDLFRQDATFLQRTSLWRGAAGGVSFESYNARGRFIRHRQFQLWLDPPDGTDLFRLDGTYLVRAPLAPALRR